MEKENCLSRKRGKVRSGEERKRRMKKEDWTEREKGDVWESTGK